MIKRDLITGFLGSGKTTFIRKYVKYLTDKGLKIGILENDYGAVNVDAMLLQDILGESCDLEMVFYCMIEKGAEANTTALIYNSNLGHWNVREDDVYRAAMNNTARILPASITEMSQLLETYEDYGKVDMGITKEEIESCQLYVLTNDCRINGAACMLYENMLKDFADRIGSNKEVSRTVIEFDILVKAKGGRCHYYYDFK